MDIMMLEYQCVKNAMVFVKHVRYHHSTVIHVIKMNIFEFWLIINVFAKMDILIMEVYYVRVNIIKW